MPEIDGEKLPRYSISTHCIFLLNSGQEFWRSLYCNWMTASQTVAADDTRGIACGEKAQPWQWSQIWRCQWGRWSGGCRDRWGHSMHAQKEPGKWLPLPLLPLAGGGLNWEGFASSLTWLPSASCPYLVSFHWPVCHVSDGEQGQVLKLMVVAGGGGTAGQHHHVPRRPLWPTCHSPGTPGKDPGGS